MIPVLAVVGRNTSIAVYTPMAQRKITAIAALVVVLIAIGIGMVFGWEPAAAVGLLGVLAYRIFIDPPVRHSDDPDPPELR